MKRKSKPEVNQLFNLDLNLKLDAKKNTPFKRKLSKASISTKTPRTPRNSLKDMIINYELPLIVDAYGITSKKTKRNLNKVEGVEMGKFEIKPIHKK